MTDFDSKVAKMRKNDEFILSQSSNIIVTVERSSDGKKLRFVKTYSNGSFIVVKEIAYTLRHYIKPNEISEFINTETVFD